MNKKRLFFILLILICCLCLTTVNAQDMNNITEVDEDSSIELVGDVGDSNDLLSDSVNDVYFDASQENDNGDGSKEHPYKYLNARKLSSNCIAHFASGEYKLDTLKYIYSDIQFIGENSENTIIKYKGMAFSIGVGYSLTASGLTFKNAAIRNFGTLDCNDCIFKESTAAFVDDYENSFGGAIYCKIGGYSVTYSPGAYLTNCTFSNNYAAYGGAIYIEGGVLNIDDSTFIDNAASGFGGAIAAEEGSTLTITNSNFNKDISKGDAGGAIYSKTSSVIIRNSNFNDCKSFFGGALCNLYGQLSVSDSRFNNNSAKYEGGAIYGMYGRLSTTKSEFRNNSASNAGAIFIDNCTNIVISNSNFDFNMALVSGGAIFYNAATRITNSSNKFSNNKALSDSDVHFQENYPTYI